MTTQHNPKPAQEGHSQFAKRGQSSEERMPEDNSAEKFGPDEVASKDEIRSLREREGKPAQDGQEYGSGGSYGYGGGFEHGGEKGYEKAPETRAAGEQEEFYESTGGFGHETDGYKKAGIGHPGKNEKRPAAKTADGAPASGHPAADDAKKGYSQDSGYAQSGGSPTPGGKKT